MHRTSLMAALAIALMPHCGAYAKIKTAPLIAPGMVIQQNSDVRLSGTTTRKGATIKIKASWDRRTLKCKADDDGRWTVTIHTPQADHKPHTLTLDDGEPLTIDDVLVGEVWLASGQSNMEMPLRGFDNCPVENSTETILRAGENHDVRLFTVPKTQSWQPADSCGGRWMRSEPRNAAEFSATAYHFATTLSRALDVPVGVVVCAYGGSRVESWMKRSLLEEFPDISLKREDVEKEQEWSRPLLMYNAMFHPVASYTYKGIIWYQGESNTGSYRTYADRLALMVKSWREELGLGDIPFYSVEIAPYEGYGGSGPFLREQQHRSAGLIPNSACISTNDLVEPYECGQIHPKKKREVGMRLALTALNRCYGHSWLPCEGPRYRDMRTEGSTAILTFDHVSGGFSRDRGITGFEVAGDDRVFHPADEVRIVGNASIAVSSKSVEHPVAVRYCFRDFMPGNLHGASGLPVVPFRTDNW